MCPIIHIGGVSISSFLLFNGLGFLFGFLFLAYRLRRRPIAGLRFGEVMAILMGGGYVGTKLYYIIFDEPARFLADPWGVFWSWNGSGWFGGFVLCAGLLLVYSRRRGFPLTALLDALAPCIPVGIIFGRMGCFLAGDGCYGVPTDLPWGMTFPHGVMPTLLPVHPTPLYEILANALILLILLKIESRFRWIQPGSGELFGIYLILGGMVRFLVEFLRLNPIVLWGLTAPQLFSIALLLWGIGLIVRRRFSALVFPL